jgi:thymidylate kinase
LSLKRRSVLLMWIKPYSHQQVQKTNYTLLLTCSAEEMLQRVEKRGQSSGIASEEQDAAKKIQDFQAQNAGMENHLKAVEGYFKTVSR